MILKRVLASFISTAVLAFVVTAGVTYLYNLIVYRTGEVDWGTAFRSAIMLGVVLTYIGEKKPLKKH